MKTVAFIPIKLNNERVPGKNLKIMDDGKPLISFIIETLVSLKKDKALDEIIVYCSSEEIVKYLPYDVKWLARPASLDTQFAKSNDIIRCFIDQYDADIYAMCHATSPFIKAKHIKECIDSVKGGLYDSAFSANEIRNFLWTEGKPLNFERDNYPRTQDLVPIYEELPTPYVFTREVFETTGGRTGNKPYICCCTAIESVDIDTPEDFKLANAIHMAGLDKF